MSESPPAATDESQDGGYVPHDSAASNDVPDGEPGASNDLAFLRGRVAVLEEEQVRLLRLRAESLEAQNARIRQMTSPEVSESPPTEAWREPLAPPYLARALVSVEDHLADMDRYVAVGDDRAAAQAKIAASTRACSVLRRLCDDDDFHQMLVTMQSHAVESGSQVEAVVSGRVGDASFSDAEVQLLELVGLSKSLAQTHVDGALAAYRANPSAALGRVQNPMSVLGDLRSLRDTACQTVDVLSQGLRQEQSRRRWRRIITFGLGGTLIVVANGVGTALLGPGGVAASGAIGSAAIGVAVQGGN